ncbi:hypothetical protein [Soonwooa sp.]|uniref:hypothetical protein n=1 Tax=Soonwooa sp. TaxID=1938592 RepID=UPI0028A95B57|nr:hypothetical protein [Soonwooa sp.]
MKLIKISAAITVLCLTLFSCGNNDDKKQNGNEINLDAVINSKSNDTNAKGDNECLLDYLSKYDALLEETDVLNATGFSKDVMETKYNKVLKNAEHHEFLYKFKNGRVGKVRGWDREMELPDVVSIRSIKPMSLATFNQSYQAITDEQMQAANDALDEIAEGNSGDADADKALQKAKEQNVSKEQIKKTGGALTGMFKEVSEGYRTVEGLGDAATWNVVTNELVVLQKGVKFEIVADISNDNEKNKSTAIKLAEFVLNKCK